jgi:glycosyltransferase involved in cell wall biosynthesis
VVSGWRVKRKDTFITRTLPSLFANKLISVVTGVHLHDYGCTLKAYRREVITGFRLYGEMHRFIPVYANSVGAKIMEIPVRHHPRKYGKAKYGLERTIKVILDLFTVKFLNSYANKPIYLFGGTGILIMGISSLILLYLFFRRIFFSVSVIASPLFMISSMFFILGFQSILMGLIAELLVRTYHEAQHKPTYTIRNTVGFE